MEDAFYASSLHTIFSFISNIPHCCNFALKTDHVKNRCKNICNTFFETKSECAVIALSLLLWVIILQRNPPISLLSSLKKIFQGQMSATMHKIIIMFTRTAPPEKQACLHLHFFVCILQIILISIIIIMRKSESSDKVKVQENFAIVFNHTYYSYD